jgi:hypothetical protein
VLRIALMVFAAVLTGTGLVRSALGDPGAFVMTIWGIVLLTATVFERWRYQRTAKGSKTGWQDTDERFVDPESGKLTKVIYNPRTGERLYMPVIGDDTPP